MKNKNIDAFMIGPYDLSSSLGIPGELSHKLFKDTIKKILDMTKKYNKKIGIHLVEPDPIELKKLIKKFDFVIYSTDIIVLKRNLENIFR